MSAIAINYFTPSEQYKFSGGQTSNPEYAGNFGRYKPNYIEHILFDLDDFDKDYTASVALKPGEKLYRYQTDKMKMIDSGWKALVKINLERALVYYLVPGAEAPIFEAKGLQIDYLNLLWKK